MLVANAAQIREIDRIMIEEFNYPGILLMETAGRKSAEHLIREYSEAQRFIVMCGPGNNGGDGMVVARYLHLAGKKVRVVFSHQPEKGDAFVNFRIIRTQGIPWDVYTPDLEDDLGSWLEDTCVIVDALFGTGLREKIKEPGQSLLNFFSSAQHPIVAIDLPSGLIGDTGTVINSPLRCRETLTFQLPKICHYITPAAIFCGKITVIDLDIYDTILDRLGLKTSVLTPELLRSWYKPKELTDHKGTHGHVLCAGGSRGKGGAIALCTKASLEAGAGLATAFIPGSVACSFHRTTLEGMSIPYGAPTLPTLNQIAGEVFTSYLEDKSVVALGPGLNQSKDAHQNKDTYEFLAAVFPHIHLPLILDADALNLMSSYPDLWDLLPEATRARTIITPHPGEIARLTGNSTESIQDRRFETALKFAAERKVITVLKGAGTIITSPNGTAYFSPFLNPGLGTAGTGDALTGIIAGLIAQGYKPLQAAALGVYLHALSGEITTRTLGYEGTTATKVIRNVGVAMQELLHGMPS